MSARSATTRDIAYTALFAALIAAGAFIAVPLGPVPFTLQVMFVLLAGMALGPRLGALSALAYLVLGLVAPVYHGGTSGIAVLAGPTGGYLWGFVLGAALTGLVAQGRPASLPRLLLAGLLGLLPIYLLGASWLAVQLEAPSLESVLIAGVLQFVPFDVLKAVVAALACRALVSSPLGLPATQRDR